LIALDNDYTVSILKCHITKPPIEVDPDEENESKRLRDSLHLPSVGLINQSMGIKSPNNRPDNDNN